MLSEQLLGGSWVVNKGGYKSPHLGYKSPNMGYKSPNMGYKSPNMGYKYSYPT